MLNFGYKRIIVINLRALFDYKTYKIKPRGKSE